MRNSKLDREMAIHMSDGWVYCNVWVDGILMGIISDDMEGIDTTGCIRWGFFGIGLLDGLLHLFCFFGCNFLSFFLLFRIPPYNTSAPYSLATLLAFLLGGSFSTFFLGGVFESF